MVKPVGFDQKILLHHLDYTAIQAKTNKRKDMYAILDSYLRNDIGGAKSRKNAITMLMKIWYVVDEDVIIMRDGLLDVFQGLDRDERLLAHWIMTMVAYPFFKDVVNELGRLFHLQDDISSVVIGRRMKATYGDRRRVEVATGAVLSCMRAWGVILPIKNRTHQKNKPIIIDNVDLQAFIIHALIKLTNTNSLYINSIHQHPFLFPFDIDLNLFELREDKSFSFYYQGINDLVVEKNHIY